MNISDKISAVILCGGRSCRMGTNKAKLNTGKAGNMSFLENQIRNLSSIKDLWLSIGSGESYPDYRIRKISDRFPDSGPLGGLEASFTVCRHEAVFVVPVDMPFVDMELAVELYNIYKESKDTDAVLVIDGKGKKQHLLGFYHRSLLPILTEILEKASSCEHTLGIADSTQPPSPVSGNIDKGIRKNQDLCIKGFLEKIRVRYIPAHQLTKGIEKTFTCNTPEEYGQLNTAARPIGQSPLLHTRIPVLSFTGWSGSGKTSFLEKLIPCLTARRMSVAYLKHDAHHFEVDKEGKDSWRLTRAGTSMTGLFSQEKGVWMENRPVDLDLMLGYVHDADLVILEGGSLTPYPKILVYRESLGKGMRIDPCSCLAVISDDPVPGAIRQFAFKDTEETADYILNYCRSFMKK